MKWHRDRESGRPHAYARSAHVSRCGKALRVEALDEATATRLGRCALCVRWLACDDVREEQAK